MPQVERDRTPASGDVLVLPDGRRFRLSSAEVTLRGWWFCATAQDGSCTLQGNFRLQWDPRANVWRQEGLSAGPSDVPSPPSMREAPFSKRKQPD